MPVVNYFWDEDEDNVIEEYDDAGETIATYTTEPSLYGNVISQHRDGQTSYFHHDGVGNTVAVTDDNGDVTDRRAYSAFGETTESSGTTVFPYQYVGKKGYYWDEETGDYSVRRRVYEPAISRWRSRDPSWLSMDGFSEMEPALDGWEYDYVRNAPISFYDPSGLTRYWCCETWSPNAKKPTYGRIWTWGWFTNPRRICRKEYGLKADDLLILREKNKGESCEGEANPDVFFVRVSSANICCGDVAGLSRIGHWDVFSLRRGMIRLGYKGDPERAKKWNLEKAVLPPYRALPVYPGDGDMVLLRLRWKSLTLKFGAGAGRSCESATSSEVADCLNKAKIPIRWPLHCQLDVSCAVYGCCLASVLVNKPIGDCW